MRTFQVSGEPWSDGTTAREDVIQLFGDSKCSEWNRKAEKAAGAQFGGLLFSSGYLPEFSERQSFTTLVLSREARTSQSFDTSRNTDGAF